jgi:hypothetical protein
MSDSSRTFDKDAQQKIFSQLKDLVALVKNTDTQKAKQLQTSIQSGINTLINATSRTITQAIQNGILNALETPIHSRPKSFANVLANGLPTPGTTNTAVQKPTNPRLHKEILIKPGNQPLSLQQRTPEQIVQAIQTTTKNNKAKAIRKLPSGAIVVTVEDAETKRQLEAQDSWIQEVFGAQASVSKPSFAIALKGLTTHDLQGVSEETLLQELRTQLPSVCRAKIWRPKIPLYTRVKVLVAVHNITEANTACNEGLLWRCRQVTCEPFSTEATPQQCYKCWKWGHTQRFCRAQALCGNCGTAEHGTCARTPRCARCNGSHPARSRDCREAHAAHEKAKAAFNARPKTFQPPTQPTQPSTPARSLPVQLANLPATVRFAEHKDNGWEEVARKRKRRHPPDATSTLPNPFSDLNVSPFPQRSTQQVDLEMDELAC